MGPTSLWMFCGLVQKFINEKKVFSTGVAVLRLRERVKKNVFLSNFMPKVSHDTV